MIQMYAKEICDFLMKIPEVKSCNIYGSLCKGNFDAYSDIDIEIDVSGTDNSLFVKKLPALIEKERDLIFYDYAPSLAPEKYVLSVAMDTENPFWVVDITCTANPHCTAVTKRELAALNNLYDHTLKLFTANLKHYLRGADCYSDIEKCTGEFVDRMRKYMMKNKC